MDTDMFNTDSMQEYKIERNSIMGYEDDYCNSQ